MSRIFTFLSLLILVAGTSLIAQNIRNNPASNHGNDFEQLGTLLPTPNVYRTASGAPGHLYWQQKVDYQIECSLDEEKRNLHGKETIIYHNNSPDVLTYFWIQLDENEHTLTKNSGFDQSNPMGDRMSIKDLDRLYDNGGLSDRFGFNIMQVAEKSGKALKYTINRTMMRIDLPKPLKSGESFSFMIEWNYNIPDRIYLWGRGGYEHFEKDGNDIFTMSQWYPRLCVYSDFQGWQNHQFTGRGEFALTFGDFDVKMTVPKDLAVASTGECLNYNEVLSKRQLARMKKAKTATEPVEIITLKEAKAKEQERTGRTSTWHFSAKDVRDFAWTASRKFIWDAMYTDVEGRDSKVLCMSLYPKESYGLYRKYSTKVVAHTVRSYSHFTIPYPYPVAQSVEASSGMEYPMICFNYGRTEEDGTYSKAIKYGMIGVIVHEVGHNFFPMIVNSDERQWSWFDEGLNTFVQYLTEELFDNTYPSRRGPAHLITDYMSLPVDELEPIMVNSENIRRFGPNAYSKPATALNVLRETIMGRELFDYAFKEYSRRWAFKHPEPADFFRTMEDASAVDLDWFWRGWFYGIKPVDIALDSVTVWEMSTEEILKKDEKPRSFPQINKKPLYDISKQRNKADGNIKFAVDQDEKLRDFYDSYRPWETKDSVVMREYNMADFYEEVSDYEKVQKTKGKYFYELYFSNVGGLVSPIIIGWTYEDGSYEKETIDAQIWRKNEQNVVKSFVKNKKVKSIQIDPNRQTADIDESNQMWPSLAVKSNKSKFQLYKEKKERKKFPNAMQRNGVKMRSAY